MPIINGAAFLSLTEKGTAFVEQIKQALAEVTDGLLGPLDPNERETMLALLSRL